MNEQKTLKRICVYCGSNSGNDNYYEEQARILGDLLTEREITLVYGGARIGIMGAIADEILKQGGEVIGIIPRHLVHHEVAHNGLMDLRIVGSMHERKALMEKLSDGFIALPGGLGTLEELFEMLTWAQLGLHNKPCGILNISGYFDSLIRFLDIAVNEGFLKPANRSLLKIASEAETLLNEFERHQSPVS